MFIINLLKRWWAESPPPMELDEYWELRELDERARRGIQD